jgi:hypothetical protein
MSGDTALTIQDTNIINNIVLKGDISGLKPEDKIRYYHLFCQKLNLNPATQPFQILNLQGKEKLYATKDCTEQLRKINGVSIIDMTSELKNNIYIVTVKAVDKEGKTDISTGAVDISNQKGDRLANSIMKAETKAKRRVTLSICGLGVLDESEIDSIPGEKEQHDINHEIPEKEKEFIQKIYDCNTIENLENHFKSNNVLSKKYQLLFNEKRFIFKIDQCNTVEDLKELINSNKELGKKHQAKFTVQKNEIEKETLLNKLFETIDNIDLPKLLERIKTIDNKEDWYLMNDLLNLDAFKNNIKYKILFEQLEEIRINLDIEKLEPFDDSKIPFETEADLHSNSSDHEYK